MIDGSAIVTGLGARKTSTSGIDNGLFASRIRKSDDTARRRAVQRTLPSLQSADLSALCLGNALKCSDLPALSGRDILQGHNLPIQGINLDGMRGGKGLQRANILPILRYLSRQGVNLDSAAQPYPEGC